MVMGQSAATAAVQAIEQNTTVQSIDLAKLKARLLADKQVLDFEPVAGESKAGLVLPGIVVDDSSALRRGFEAEGSAVGGFVGAGYRHDGDSEKGAQTMRFVPALPASGSYRVAITYTPLANRSEKVPVTIHHAEGETTVFVNQQNEPSGPGRLHVLGTFKFEAGTSAWLEISNKGTRGHVIADAAQWLSQ